MTDEILLIILIIWLAITFRVILKRITRRVAPYKEPFWIYVPGKNQIHIYFRSHRKIIEDIKSIQEARAYFKRDDHESNIQQL